jgi:hypothetical protein
MVIKADLTDARAMSYERRGCGRQAAHRSARRTVLRHAPSVLLRGVRRGVASQLNRWPARCARESGGAPVALSPVRGWTAFPAPVGPVAQPDRMHPGPGRIKSQIMHYKGEITA